MHERKTFVELMCARADEHGDRTALIFSVDPLRAEADETMTYGELDQAARRVAALLQERFAVGDRLLVLHPSGPGFARSLLGCMYAGMVPVPAPPPDGRQRRQADRLAAIARDAGAAGALADGTDLEALASWAKEQDLRDVTVLAPHFAGGSGGDSGQESGQESGADSAVDELPEASRWRPPPADPHALALLQYTSGSTADPKGVMVDHANLLANAEILAAISGMSADGPVGGWLPLYHDFGLIGLLLTPLVLGGRSVLMPPVAFLKRPHTWLTLIDRHGIDFSPAPNFAYDLCVQRITDEELARLDLSRWRCAVNGAEPVQAATVEAFTRRFTAAGLRPEAMLPGYGMAETTLVVSGDRPARRAVITEVDAAAFERGELLPPAAGAPVHRIVSSGPAEHLDVRIIGVHAVDADAGRTLPDGRVGEIWVRGPNVARGYWGRPAETRRVFDAVTPDGESGFLRTGDLGILHEGELYVTGRTKELIIVRGRNLYPQDLEAATREAHPALERGVGAAFSVPVPEEEVVIVRECPARQVAPDELARVAASVRDRLTRDVGVPAQNVVLVPPGTVARTTSGKIQRRLLRRRFLGGELPILHAELSPAVRARLGEAAGDSAGGAAGGDAS
ncbi:fatty acyl-AMP ligase [Streptomyces spongiae]|uniref:Fatty acyl-AMP ligase n=1 Tax=Streptomyces spongiae TaxID=565072 RepID=A0A5N8XEV9_9ACTN|nr:fatty acyl-AMP ligase [Streptomyces spongiae]MPY58063.1 fatty acyl-AMP ligase [Streptomyces spongiae]